MRTVYTCDGDPPMCDNKGAEKIKGGRSKEEGAEGGERRAGGDTTQIHITGTAVSTTREGCAEHSLRSILKEPRPE